MSTLEYVYQLLMTQLVRIWLTDNAWSLNLDEAVRLVVALPYQYEHKQLADLAVNEDAVARIHCQYDTANFQQLGDEDPMVLAQKPQYPTLKKLQAYEQLRNVYHEYQIGRNVDNSVRTWLEGRLQWIHFGLDTLRSSIVVCPYSSFCTEY